MDATRYGASVEVLARRSLLLLAQRGSHIPISCFNANKLDMNLGMAATSPSLNLVALAVTLVPIALLHGMSMRPSRATALLMSSGFRTNLIARGPVLLGCWLRRCYSSTKSQPTTTMVGLTRHFTALTEAFAFYHPQPVAFMSVSITHPTTAWRPGKCQNNTHEAKTRRQPATLSSSATLGSPNRASHSNVALSLKLALTHALTLAIPTNGEAPCVQADPTHWLPKAPSISRSVGKRLMTNTIYILAYGFTIQVVVPNVKASCITTEDPRTWPKPPTERCPTTTHQAHYSDPTPFTHGANMKNAS